ncbi:hypothetical protein P9281_34795 [Caballeronia sp. LP003]|uniref:hypothetical protein n=1 Tax=Caballeronia sp. LP003 TaxID=3038551 RepID=UPI002863D41A|nr:hypothetical protein [Caballeronia sp. LP003]MDR5791718.1 hypothetical protein [Caballeronia sp. LP003]
MTQLEKSDFVQTRCPAQIIVYLKSLAMLKYGTLLKMHDDMLRKFIASAPWEKNPPLNWRKPRAAQTVAGESVSQTGWKTFNVQVSSDLKAEVMQRSEELGVSASSFVYTAIYWWVAYIWPPK